MKVSQPNLEQKLFEQRKADHIALAINSKTQNLTANHFDQIRLVHEALPDCNLSEVDIRTKLLGQSLASPHFISSMTAGHKDSVQINEVLAQVAGEKQWLMGVGSQRRELTDGQAHKEWQKIRKSAHKTKFVSNIGIEELIKYPIEQVLKLIDSIEAVGIYVHLNPLQEAFQNYNQAEFRGGLIALKKLIQKSPVPVLVKEVGFGMSSSTAQKLFTLGVEVVDVAGKGGTHWGILEGLRQQGKNEMLHSSSYAFSDWGYSTVESLLNSKSLIKKNQFWASGGIRNGVDSFKCLALGAKAIGIAQPLIKAALQSAENSKFDTAKASIAVSNIMEKFDYELRVALFATGVVNLKELSKKKVIYENRNV